MRKITKVVLVITFMMFLTSLVFAKPPVEGGKEDPSNTTAIVLALIATITPTMGLWISYRVNTSKRDKIEVNKALEESKRHILLIDKITESDLNQSKELEKLSCRINEITSELVVLKDTVGKQSETVETNNSIRKIKFLLEQSSNVLLKDMNDLVVKEVITYGVGKLYNIFSGVLIQEFDVKLDNLELQLSVAIKQIFGFYPSKSKLSVDRNKALRLVLIDKVETLLKKYIIDLYSIIQLKNGNRRSKYIDTCTDLTENSIILSLAIYNKFIQEDEIKNI